MINKKTLIYGIVISSIIAFVMIEFYARYIQINSIDDWYLADTAANFFGFFPLNFLFLLVAGNSISRQNFMIPLGIAIGFILYEIIQLFMPWQTFDYYDIFATVLAMAVCMLINIMLGFYSKIRRVNNKL